MNNGIIISLLIFCLLGIGYIIYSQQIAFPKKMEKCNEIAMGLEKARHAPVDDGLVTNQDLSGYMKNIVSCLSE
jgi:hypothetical protein